MLPTEIIVLLALWGMVGINCFAQQSDVVCRDGDGSFKAVSATAVEILVGASRNGELASRRCQALLRWKNNSVTVATEVSEIDVDTFNVDLGFSFPVTTLQIKNSATDDYVLYQIYSLDKDPRLLRTLTGAEFFSAADTDLDGRVEIWTADAVAVAGFEHLSRAELNPPVVVLRFQRNVLVDVSPEFRSYYDNQTTSLRHELDAAAVSDFIRSDGTLKSIPGLSSERLHQLRAVKATILEIVWNYLYSGRPEQAWNELAHMWPPSDQARIKAAILNARATGLVSEAVSTSEFQPHTRSKRAYVFDGIDQPDPEKLGVRSAAAILMRRPAPQDQLKESTDSRFDLTIDSAGKVRAAEPAGNNRVTDSALLQAARNWKFIPALKNGRPVASRIRLSVWAPQ